MPLKLSELLVWMQRAEFFTLDFAQTFSYTRPSVKLHYELRMSYVWASKESAGVITLMSNGWCKSRRETCDRMKKSSEVKEWDPWQSPGSNSMHVAVIWKQKGQSLSLHRAMLLMSCSLGLIPHLCEEKISYFEGYEGMRTSHYQKKSFWKSYPKLMENKLMSGDI